MVVINTSIFVNIVVIRELWNFRLCDRVQHRLHLVGTRPSQLPVRCRRCHFLQQRVLIDDRTVEVLKLQFFGYRLWLILLLPSDGRGAIRVQEVRVFLGLLHIQMLLLPLDIIWVNDGWKLSACILGHETSLSYHYLSQTCFIIAFTNYIL